MPYDFSRDIAVLLDLGLPADCVVSLEENFAEEPYIDKEQYGERRYVHLHLDDTNDLADLTSCIRRGEFVGMLVVAVPPDFDRLQALLTHCRHKITLEVCRLYTDSYTIDSIEGCLAAVEAVAQSGAAAVVLASPIETDDKANFRFRCDTREAFDPKVHRVLRDYTRRFDFPKIAELRFSELRSLTEPNWGPYDANAGTVLNQLSRYELSPQARPLIEGEGLVANYARPLKVLGILRMCRWMATWMHEQRPFACTVLVASKREYDSMSRSGEESEARLHRILDLPDEKAVPFDCLNNDPLQGVAEMCQSQHMVMWVDITDGKLKGIAAYKGLSQEVRVSLLSKLTENQSSFIAHMRDGGFVEFYDDGDLALWYDNFRWRKQPFRQLIRVLFAHFNPDQKSSILGTEVSKLKVSALESPLDHIVDAVAFLMDRHDGSIIVLLHPNDERYCDRVFRELRPEFVEIPEVERVNALSVHSLAAFLQLDGAHVIARDSTFRLIAQQIYEGPVQVVDIAGQDETAIDQWASRISGERRLAKVDRENRKLFVAGEFEESCFDRLDESVARTLSPILREAENPLAGTGRKAARYLSRVLPSSSVVKISAAGDLYIFQKGQRLGHGGTEVAPRTDPSDD